ncbi:hypothetical protein J26TS2_44900 [Shouchella clausii]|nr:hypothetical protein J26TS2_44900 [Shouchella clausii]
MKKFINAMKEKRQEKANGSEPAASRKPKQKPVKQKSSREIAFSKKKTQKIASFTIIGIMLVSLFFNVVHFTKVQSIRNSVAASEKAVSNQLNDLEQGNLLESHSVVVYAEDFLKRYINIPSSDEEQEKRLEQLGQYFVSGFDVSSIEELTEFNGHRSLNYADFIEVNRKSNNEADVHFRIGYDIVEIVEREETEVRIEENDDGDEEEIEETVIVEDEVTKTNTAELIIPVITDGEGFAITDKPGISARNMQSNIEYEAAPLPGEDASNAEKDTISAFLEEFFVSFGQSDEKLAFMANMDRGLKDKVLEAVNVKEATIDEDNRYHVRADVYYRDAETNVSNVYSFELEISNSSTNDLYVEKIN